MIHGNCFVEQAFTSRPLSAHDDEDEDDDEDDERMYGVGLLRSKGLCFSSSFSHDHRHEILGS